MNYTKHYQTKQTPQSQPIPGKTMVQNNAEGYSFEVDDWTRLDRFLILGSEGGTYYVGERKLTIQNAEVVQRCIQTNGPRVVSRIVEISNTGRAPKNDPALFALAMCAGVGNSDTRKAALDALPKVARIGTHLFHFMQYVEGFRGWGRGLRQAIGNWYLRQKQEDLAYQVVKYQQRDGWSHRDALRLAHPVSDSPVLRWIIKGEADGIPAIIQGFEKARQAENEKGIIEAITTYNLSWEMIPTQWLASSSVWKALLPRLPLTAMLRNLGRITANGLLKPMSEEVGLVAEKLTNQEALRKARIHPVSILAALKTYEQGKGEKGSLQWSPVREIVDALDSTFYLSFGNIEPTGKRLVFGLDVSGSMAGTKVNGIPNLSAREACGLMALVTAKVEKQYAIVAFDTNAYPLDMSPRQRLDDVIKVLEGTGGGGTDCAIPIAWAIHNQIQSDAFIILTDSETWQGAVHPVQAIEKYRQTVNPQAKMVVVAMAANHVSLADSTDAGMMNCVGFDTATPQLITDFVS